MADLLPDSELLEAWRQGDSEAGQALFRRHYDAIYRFFSTKVPPEAVQDLVQETFATLVRKRDEFAGKSSFLGYLYGIARLHLYEQIRRLHKLSLYDDLNTFSIAALGGSPSSMLNDKQEHRLLGMALARIPLEYQILLELYLWEDLTGAQLAEIMDIPENTMRSRLRRAKSVLEQEFRSIADDPAQAIGSFESFSGWLDDVQHAARKAYPQLKDD
jgi:RNA polymerase sigma factor (sigma-70 family)